MVQKNFEGKKQNNVGTKHFLVKKIFVSKYTLSKKKLVNKDYDSKKLGPKSLVKIRAVTAEIMLIWTIVVRTYVDRTNVTMPVGICYRRCQEPNVKVWSKSGHKLLRYS